jgi:hypothetical protein
MLFRVRMAAMMSRAFAFSPVASATGASFVASFAEVIGSGAFAGSAGGLVGRESKSVGWRRDALMRAANDCG